MSLITKYTAEAQNPDYTIDSVTVLNDDYAVAVGYDAAAKQWLLLEGRKDEEGGICFTPQAPRYRDVAEAIHGVALVAEGVLIFTAAAGQSRD